MFKTVGKKVKGWVNLNWLFGSTKPVQSDLSKKRQQVYTELLERRLEAAEREGNETLKIQLEEERSYLAGQVRQ